MSKVSVSAVILAAGVGKRMMSDITKQQIKILGKTVLQRTVEAFDAAKSVTEIVVVAKADELEYIENTVKSATKKPYRVVLGGDTRAESARRGFSAIDSGANLVAIHDGARCLITPNMIDAVVEKAASFGAASAVAEVTDTLKQVDEQGIIRGTLPRKRILKAQTPQVFSVEIYSRALSHTDSADEWITDDNMLVEALGIDIHCVNLGQNNIKITTNDDLILAEMILNKRGE